MARLLRILVSFVGLIAVTQCQPVKRASDPLENHISRTFYRVMDTQRSKLFPNVSMKASLTPGEQLKHTVARIIE